MSVVMDTPSSSNNPTGIVDTTRARVSKPDAYNGERGKLEEWLLQLDLYFKFNPEIDGRSGEKVLLAATYMRGAAAKWIRPTITKYLDPEDEDDEVIRTVEEYQVFKEKIRHTFGISSEESTAVRAIQHLSQKRSAAEYYALFQQYSAITDWNDAALMTMFRRGLKTSVREELMRTGAQIETLDQLATEAIIIDDRIHEFRMEEEYDRNARRGRFGKITGYPTTLRRTPHRQENFDRMEIDNIGQGNRNVKFKKPRNKGQKGTCYACGRKGHFARDCRSKNIVQRHVAVLEEAGSTRLDTEHWTIVHKETKDSDTEMTDSTATTEEEPEEEERGRENEDKYALGKLHQWDFLRQQAVDKIWKQPRKMNKQPRQVTFTTPEEENDDDKENIPPTNGPTFPSPPRSPKGITTAKMLHESRKYRYNLDYRNLNHDLIHWEQCHHDGCAFHNWEKGEADFWPTPVSTCKWQYFDCPKPKCGLHLYDKRERTYFYGVLLKDVYKFRFMLNRSCLNDMWQMCLNKECEKHAYEKEYHGFGIKSFLDSKNPEPESPEEPEEPRASTPSMLIHW
jgi:hypothetical protein